jgi:hypothetical protein
MFIWTVNLDLGYDAEHRSQVEVVKVFLPLTKLARKPLKRFRAKQVWRKEVFNDEQLPDFAG